MRLRSQNLYRNAVGLVALGTFLACTDAGDVTEPVVEQLRGALEWYGDTAGVELPDTVDVATDFAVTVSTFGGGCTSLGLTEARTEGSVATIEPFDSVVTRLPPGAFCTDVLRTFDHVATIRFSDLGVATLRIVGRREPGGESVTLERTVVVR